MKYANKINLITVITATFLLTGFACYNPFLRIKPKNDNNDFPGFVWIKPGKFMMGSPLDEPGRQSNETQHKVTLTKGFYMGKYEVTQGEWYAIMGNYPSYFTSSPEGNRDNLPVEEVTWYDTVEYCNKRSEDEGLTPFYTLSGRYPTSGYPITSMTVTAPADWSSRNGYRLPTEAEWEYACRAGTTTAWYTGNTEDAALQAAAWYSVNSGSKTHEVGLKSPNAWGLYDMQGNVSEWCWDWYGGDYGSGAQEDPTGASSGTVLIDRGGSWGLGGGAAGQLTGAAGSARTTATMASAFALSAGSR